MPDFETPHPTADVLGMHNAVAEKGKARQANGGLVAILGDAWLDAGHEGAGQFMILLARLMRTWPVPAYDADGGLIETHSWPFAEPGRVWWKVGLWFDDGSLHRLSDLNPVWLYACRARQDGDRWVMEARRLTPAGRLAAGGAVGLEGLIERREAAQSDPAAAVMADVRDMEALVPNGYADADTLSFEDVTLRIIPDEWAGQAEDNPV